MRIKMKKLLMSVSFLVLLSSASMAKTETITEEVCNAPNGCRIEMNTGKCIGCVMITRTIVTKDPMVIVKKSITKNETRLVASVDKSDWPTALCKSGCSSARAALLGYKHDGKFWKRAE
jgi:hypothetical protein